MSVTLTRSTELRRRHRNPVPYEGDGGLYSQSWFPICSSADLEPGQVLGRAFLGGRVVAWRGQDGIARIQSAYCPHLGADLSLGTVVGDALRCAFHHWELGGDGRCLRTGIGDPAPPHARVFDFPVCEKYGVVFAFNGETPLFELRDLDVPDTRTVSRVSLMPMRTDPWMFCANVPDFQHFIMVHRTHRDDIGKYERITWNRYGLAFEFTAYPDLGKAPPIPFKVEVQGTSVIFVQGHLPDGRWYGTFAAMSLPRPRMTDVFISCSVERSEDAAADTALLDVLTERFFAMAAEDRHLLETAHYTPGTLTRQDEALARYMQMLRDYPRANPAAEFLN